MALTNVLLISQVAGYIVALILSLCIIVPMSLHQDEFNESLEVSDVNKSFQVALLFSGDLTRWLILFIGISFVDSIIHTSNHPKVQGHCLLFSTGVWQETDGQLVVNWASPGWCNYTIFVGLIVFITSVIQIYRLSMMMYRGEDSSFLSAFIDVISSIFLAMFILIAAITITLGFMTWCQCMEKRFPSCDLAAGNDIDKTDNIDTSEFYIELGVAQFGAWSSLSIWVGLSVFAVLKLLRYHQLENMKVSMYRERRRLIQAAGNSQNIS